MDGSTYYKEVFLKDILKNLVWASSFRCLSSSFSCCVWKKQIIHILFIVLTGYHRVPLGTNRVPLGTNRVPLGTNRVPLCNHVEVKEGHNGHKEHLQKTRHSLWLAALSVCHLFLLDLVALSLISNQEIFLLSFYSIG